jgi:CBS domain-containing protein
VIYSNQEVKRFPIKPNPLEKGGGKRRVFIMVKDGRAAEGRGRLGFLFKVYSVYTSMTGLARKRRFTMLARQLMHKELVTILPSATVHEAALKMKEHGVGSVLVVEEGWKLKGILTDRDIAITVAADFKEPRVTSAGDIMTKDPITIEADADIDSALRIMKRATIRRLPVTENGRLVGLLSSADVATEIKEELDQFIGLEEAFAKH